MPELTTVPKTIEKTLEDHHYPSSVDNMMRNDTPFEGTETSLPVTAPIPGASGTLPVTTISKTK